MTSIVVSQSLAPASCSSLMAPSPMPWSFKSGTFLAPGPSSAVSSRSVKSKSRPLLDTRMPVSPSREEGQDALERRFRIHVGGIPNHAHQSPFFFSFFPTLSPLAGKAVRVVWSPTLRGGRGLSVHPLSSSRCSWTTSHQVPRERGMKVE